MIELKLRQEFRGKRLQGTTVNFTTQAKTGAIEVPAADFLRITYPSFDLLKTIEATGPQQSRPVVLLGSRGQGKSHLMAALYHLCTSPDDGRAWLDEWADRLKDDKVRALGLRSDACVIAESLHKQRYKFLWDILFERHPKGQHYLYMWNGQGDKKTDWPSDEIMLGMFKEQPTVLILDEFQTWFEGLTNTKQYPWRNWAFAFIQMLSEIAQDNPELLSLVVSVRDGASDAYQQVHRVNPVRVDFKGPLAKRDRQRLLLYRIFENRMQVPPAQIELLVGNHVSECFRLGNVPQSEHEKRREEFIEAWPFAPHALKLLDDQVLVATDAQETRDLIRILVDLFKHRNPSSPIITAADFSLTDERSGVSSLLDSVANQLHKDLREKALRNLEAVRDAVRNPKTTVPHCEEIISALWLRSLNVDTKTVGAMPAELQIDITRDKPIDDNQFEAELATIVENSFNIHPAGERLVFRREENPQAKLLAHAKNDKLFQNNEDVDHLAKEVRSVIGGPETVSRTYRVVVLKKKWDTDPWSEFEEKDYPKNWDGRLPIVVVPVYPDKLEAALGNWLKTHLQTGRNTIRFLLPQKGTSNIYYDRELIVLSRAVYLALKWGETDAAYRPLRTKFAGELTDKLKSRFDRFAVLDEWNYAEPAKCRFEDRSHNAQGDKIPEAIDKIIKQHVFIPEEFENYVLLLAGNGESLGKLLKDLREPRSGGKPCITWLGETDIKERAIRMCAAGQIAINLRGMELLQANPGETEDAAWMRMKGKLGTGKHLDDTTMYLPDAVVTSGGKTIVVTDPETGAGEVIGGSEGGTTVTVTPGGGTSDPDEGGEGGVGNLFGDDEQQGETSVAESTPHSASHTSSLNLLGQVESWGIGPATSVANVKIKVQKMTGAQLQQLLKNLPDGVTYGLDLDKEGN